MCGRGQVLARGTGVGLCLPQACAREHVRADVCASRCVRMDRACASLCLCACVPASRCVRMDRACASLCLCACVPAPLSQVDRAWACVPVPLSAWTPGMLENLALEGRGLSARLFDLLDRFRVPLDICVGLCIPQACATEHVSADVCASRCVRMDRAYASVCLCACVPANRYVRMDRACASLCLCACASFTDGRSVCGARLGVPSWTVWCVH